MVGVPAWHRCAPATATAPRHPHPSTGKGGVPCQPAAGQHARPLRARPAHAPWLPWAGARPIMPPTRHCLARGAACVARLDRAAAGAGDSASPIPGSGYCAVPQCCDSVSCRRHRGSARPLTRPGGTVASPEVAPSSRAPCRSVGGTCMRRESGTLRARMPPLRLTIGTHCGAARQGWAGVGTVSLWVPTDITERQGRQCRRQPATYLHGVD